MSTSIIPYAKAPELHLIEILNPFDPRERLHRTLEWQRDQAILDYLPAYEGEFVASINGRVINSEELALTYPAPGDHVVFCPVPAGGGGGGGGTGKTVLRIVAMIAITYFTYGAGSAAWAADMAAAGYSSFAIAAMQAGLFIAGSMLVNSMLPVSPLSQVKHDFSDSPTYGIDGPRNTSAEGLPIPVCYGTFRMAGNLINTLILPNGSTQDLYLMLAAGEGEIAYLSDVLVNNVPIADYQNWDMRTSLGSGDAAGCEWFSGVYTSIDQGAKLLSNTDWCYYTTQTAVDQFRVDCVAQQGLFDVDDKGNVLEVAVPIAIEYCLHGSNNWQALSSTVNISGYVREETHWFQQQGGLFSGRYAPPSMHPPASIVNTGTPVTDGSQGGPIYDSNGVQCGTWRAIPQFTGNTVMQDKTRSASRAYFLSPKLASGVYDIRVQRTTAQATVATQPRRSDAITLSDIVEIVDDTIGYKNLAWVAIKITLYDQLNQIPQVTYLNGGRTVNVYADDGSVLAQPSANPAWIALDMLTHTRYGGAMDLSRFDMEKWREWANWCDANNFTFNGVIDTDQNLWDALQYVMRCGHAQLINIGTRYSVAIERADDPVMLFTVANIVEGSFQENWLPMSDRANEINISYADKNDFYREHTIKVVDAEKLAAGYPVNSSAITLYGVVDPDRAYKEGLLLLNMNRYVTQTVKFDVSVDALACTVGDVVLVQHDMPQWGYAGVIKGGDATNVVVDRPMSMTAGQNYSFMCLHDTVQRATGAVNQVIGSSVFLPGYDGVSRVRRLVVNGVECNVLSYFPAAGGMDAGVVVDNPSAVSVGGTYTLWDTDVIETAPVASLSADGLTVTLSTPLSAPPAKYSRFSFGEVAKVSKPFRIKTIGATQEYTRTLTCLEYNASIYDLTHDPVPTPNYSDLTSTEQVTNLSAQEDVVFMGNVSRSRVRFSWQGGNDQYRSGDVYISLNGAPLVKMGNDPGNYVVEASQGDVIICKVVAVDVNGNHAPYTTAPQITYTVKGKDTAPTALTSLTATGDYFQIQLAWTYGTSTDLSLVEIWASLGTSSFSGAHLLTAVPYPATGYTHTGLNTGDWWYYWARVKDTAGNYSDYYPLSTAPGVGAQVSYDAANLLDLLNDQITKSQLAQDLQTALDVATGPTQDMLDQINGIETSAESTAEALIQQVLDMNDRWNTNRSQGSDITNLSSTVNANKASFDNWVQTQTTTNQSVATEITTLQGNVGDNTAAITNIENLTVDATSALMTRFTGLDASISGNSGKIQDIESLNLDASTALMTRFSSLDASIGDNKASIQNIENLSLDASSALMTKLDSMNTSIGNNTAAINDVTSLNLDAGTALMTKFSTMNATISSNDTKQTGNYNNIVTLKLDSTTALMTQLNSLQTSTNNNSAAITNEQTARANGDSANASSINSLTTTVNGNTSSIQTLQTVTTGSGGLTSQYMVKTDVNGYVSGFGLYNNGATSQFIVNSDYFAVGKSGYNKKYPFIIGTVNGQQVVAMDKAFIVDAAVDTLQINGNAVTVPVYAGDSSVITGTGAFVTVAQCSITIPAGLTATIVAQASVAQGYPNGVGSTGTARLWIGGTLVFEATGSAAANTLALAGGLAVGSGTFTVQLQWMGSDANIQQGWKGLTAFAAKR